LLTNGHISKNGASDPNFLRCNWCGIPVSNNWIIMQNGKRFCSRNCYIANSGQGGTYFASAGMICFGLLAGLLWTVFEFMNSSVVQASILTGFLMGSPLILGGILLHREEKKSIDVVKTKTPRNSRLYDLIYVEKISPMAKCPAYGGNLDLTGLDNSAVIKCEYCGAMGVLKFE
jgi:hypothetical protein